MYASVGVHVLQVVYQLRQVFNRVDVMMRRRRYQLYARRGPPDRCDVLRYLPPGYLTAFSRLRTLRHLDLKIAGVDHVLRRHAEPAGCDLFDS